MVKIRSLQLNPIVGDITGNRIKLIDHLKKAAANGIDLCITPECYLSGYPPEDLIFRPAFQQALTKALTMIAESLKNLDIALIIGTPPRFENGYIYNAAMWIYKGTIEHICDKKCLPDYGTFDDTRLFSVGSYSKIINFKHKNIGVLICEDMWHTKPSQSLQENGADLLICLNASPFEIGKFEKRLVVAKDCVKKTQIPLVTSFMIGGQDELVFDGHSFALNKDNQIIAQANGFQEDFFDVSFDNNHLQSHSLCDPHPFNDNAFIYQAITLGLRDYVSKNKFKGVVLGLSGGVDSVLSAVVAVDAIGAERVHCLLLPSQYTSQNSFDDAYALIKTLGISYDIISIQDSVNSIEASLEPIFTGYAPDVTEENIQSRVRGLMLMAYSNKMGHMVLTTGNKSEMAVGYATLYGDMCGGYNALKDIYKTKIYELCHYRNDFIPEIALKKIKNIIPQTVITKAPTAELRADQKDSDSLPDYDILDAILTFMIEDEKSIEEIINLGYEANIVKRIRLLIDRSEYKRQQSAIGTKITAKNFGRDRRYPVTNHFNY